MCVNEFFDLIHCHAIAQGIRDCKMLKLHSSKKSRKMAANLQPIKEEYKKGMGALQHWQRLRERREKLTERNETGIKLTQAEISELEDQELQIPKLKKKLWEHRKKEYNLRRALPDRKRKYHVVYEDFLQREKVNRRHARTYGRPLDMNKEEIAECSGLGGCCRRGCGCCWKPRAELPGEGKIYGHCTDECGCCLEYFNSVYMW